MDGRKEIKKRKSWGEKNSIDSLSIDFLGENVKKGNGKNKTRYIETICVTDKKQSFKKHLMNSKSLNAAQLSNIKI